MIVIFAHLHDQWEVILTKLHKRHFLVWNHIIQRKIVKVSPLVQQIRHFYQKFKMAAATLLDFTKSSTISLKLTVR